MILVRSSINDKIIITIVLIIERYFVHLRMLLKKGSKKDPKGIDADHADKMDHKSYLKRGTKEKKNRHLYKSYKRHINFFTI